MDSGCSNHMTSNLNAFINLDKLIKKRVKMGDDTICQACGKGSVKVNSCGFSCINDVIYVPDLDSSLLSVGQFLKYGYALLFEDMACAVFPIRRRNTCCSRYLWQRTTYFLSPWNAMTKHLQPLWMTIVGYGSTGMGI